MLVRELIIVYHAGAIVVGQSVASRVVRFGVLY